MGGESLLIHAVSASVASSGALLVKRTIPFVGTNQVFILSFIFDVEDMSNFAKTMSNFERPFLRLWHCDSALLPLGNSDSSCSSRFLSALVASLQAARTCNECSGASMHVEFSFSHVESMSNFGRRGHFSTWAAENDVEKV
jgi:hypothetical protein